MKWCEIRAVRVQNGTQWALYIRNGYYETYLHEISAKRAAARALGR